MGCGSDLAETVKESVNLTANALNNANLVLNASDLTPGTYKKQVKNVGTNGAFTIMADTSWTVTIS